jgi:crossover junction endodeoxyribonuclease RusA
MVLALEFVPPDRRSRDDDNLVAAFKSGRDGIAEALGVDDRLFLTEFRMSDETKPGGCVRVTLRGAE